MASEAKTRRTYGSPDYMLLLATVGLVIIGLMMVYSATFDWSYQKFHNSFRIASGQFLWTGVGMIALMLTVALPYDWWRRMAVPLMGTALLMLILVLLLGQEKFGARRSFLDGSIQPSELAKPAVVIYVAAWLASKGDEIRDVTYGLIPFAVLIGIVAGLIVLQPDMGTTALVVLTALAMFFFAGADVFQLAVGGTVSTITFFLLVNQLPYAKERLEKHVFVWEDPTGAVEHVQQALIALGSGGPLGVGLGQSQQKLGYLPTHHTDSIFAVLGEETGLLGCLIVIVLFAFLTYRGFRITLKAQDAFAALLACGITCWLAFQALINIAVITGLIPFTGIALPFISAGGSSKVVSMVGVGLLLSISRGKRRRSSQHANLDRRWGNRRSRLSGLGRRTGARS